MSEGKMSNSKSKLSRYKEIADLVGLYTKWGTLAVGDLCLLIYSNEIEQFPEGINLGEGLAFYLVSVGFLIAYTVFAIVVTAMGSVVMALGSVRILVCPKSLVNFNASSQVRREALGE